MNSTPALKNWIKVLALLLMAVLAVGCAPKELPEYNSTEEGGVENINFQETDEITTTVKIEMTDGGIMLVELYPDVAPVTVANFQKLVSEHFYDGLIFHRVIKNFMIQTGAPTGTGSGGAKETITGEFAANGFNNTLKHTRGVISMARTKVYDSASSQFFICQVDYPSLNGNYAAFGKMIAGFDTLDAIANTSTNVNDRPLTDQRISTVRFVTVTP